MVQDIANVKGIKTLFSEVKFQKITNAMKRHNGTVVIADMQTKKNYNTRLSLERSVRNR